MHRFKLHYLNTPIEQLFFLFFIKIKNQKKLKEIFTQVFSIYSPYFGSILFYSVEL